LSRFHVWSRSKMPCTPERRLMKCPSLNATIRSYPMKTKLALSALAAAIAVFSQGAFAQASAPAQAPANRADVKAGAQAKSVAPAGEKPTAAPSKTSDKTREERKETTKADKAAASWRRLAMPAARRKTRP
jgi:hypothetical protein